MSKNTQNILVGTIIIVIAILLFAILFFDRIKVGFQEDLGSKNEIPSPTPLPVTIYPTLQPNKECQTVTNIEQALQNVQETCILDLSGQDISSLPSEIINLTRLEKLILTDTNITKAEKEKIKAGFPKTVEVIF